MVQAYFHDVVGNTCSSNMSFPTRNPLDNLPVEILSMIMNLSHGICALYHLVCANNRIEALFAERPYAYMLSAIQHSGMESQLQKIYCTIIAIRLHYKYSVVNGNFRAYIHALLKDQSNIISLDLELLPPSKPFDLLKDAAAIYKHIQEAEISVYQTQLNNLMTRIQTHIDEDKISFLNFENEKRPQSPTELHRIRRALWRLFLYYEAYFTPYTLLATEERARTQDFDSHVGLTIDEGFELWELSSESRTEYMKIQKVFFCQMTVWELEEMECVWYHLAHQNKALNGWRRICPFCQQNVLPDSLIVHIRWCRGSPLYTVHSIKYLSWAPSFEEACGWFRLYLELGLGGMETKENNMVRWLDGPAREPSIGFTFLLEHHRVIRPDDPPPTVARDGWTEFLPWGYCIWDRARLEACELVNSEDRQVIARLAWWKLHDDPAQII